MSITYSWEITGLKVQDFEGKPSSVVQTYWKKIGTDENGNTGEFDGATPFTVDSTDNSGPFIPFEELTEQDVINWIQSVVVGLYEEHVNSQILKKIEQKRNPLVAKSLPWSPTSTLTSPQQ